MTGALSNRGPRRLFIAGVGLTIVIAASAWKYVKSFGTFTYRDRFSAGSMADWDVYGGSWLLTGSTMTNDSDDTGAKVVAGENILHDIAMDADVRLTSSYGDAGLIVRVSKPEEGTNAFNGYYAGIRLPNELLLSRMDFGFTPLRRVTIPNGVAAGTWYHLRLTAKSCQIAAEANDMQGHLLGKATVDDDSECFTQGRFGLRSFAAGGSWRNIRVEGLR